MRAFDTAPSILVAFLLAACGDKPKAPDPKAFAAMDEQAKCTATLPRAKKCQDEMMAQQFESLADPGGSEADKKAAAELSAELREEESASDEAEAMHRTNCAASESYPDAVVTCWEMADCKAFAKCVIARDITPRTKPTSPSPSSPSPSGTAP